MSTIPQPGEDPSGYDWVGKLWDWEMCKLDDEESVQLFRFLKDNGYIKFCQGSVKQMARRMEKAGVI